MVARPNTGRPRRPRMVETMKPRPKVTSKHYMIRLNGTVSREGPFTGDPVWLSGHSKYSNGRTYERVAIVRGKPHIIVVFVERLPGEMAAHQSVFAKLLSDRFKMLDLRCVSMHTSNPGAALCAKLPARATSMETP